MSAALATFKRAHGVATHRKSGAGHRYPVMAFFEQITMKDGTVRSFTELAHEYSMATLTERCKIVEACDELTACQILAQINGIQWPADEPKRKQ